ncbi:MAG: GlsB/YeaQ/YmgE family stress response membrane protein [Marinobacter sp.]|nr:GlsB/YeaQ/YmgE family stress response membrane protein [Marinobacter sp.]
MMNLILFLIIGGVAGWLAGLIMKGRGFGVLANVGIGIVGSFIGGILFRLLGLASQGAVGELVTATVGAVLLLAIVGKLKKV